MTRYFFRLLLAMALICATQASFAVEPGQQGNTSFTNKDLEQYKQKNPEPEQQKSLQPAPEKGGNDLKNKSDHKDREYWCSKGKQLRKKVDSSKDEVNALKELIGEFKDTEVTSAGKKKVAAKKNVKKAEKNLAAAQRRLKEREALLSDLEEDAYRKGVPAGWLRCQFE